jgi:hypothetical protein
MLSACQATGHNDLLLDTVKGFGCLDDYIDKVRDHQWAMFWQENISMFSTSKTRDRCYDLLNIFAKNSAQKLAFLTQ